MTNLILPAHVGDRRYGPKRDMAVGAEDPNNETRPLTYQAEVDGRTVLIANAIPKSWRIPVDELQAMALEQRKKRIARGDAQKAVDWAKVMSEYSDDRKNAAWDRRNGRVSVGYATFRGDRAR